MASKNAESPARFRYESLAAKLSGLIQDGVLARGDRLPSVRRLARQEGVSISTALHAYELLERQGVVQASPRSGYFVEGVRELPPEPSASRPSPRPTYINMSETISDLLKIARQNTFVPFATAIPAPELLPARRLNQIMAGICRRADHPGVLYDLPPGNPELRRQLSRYSVDWGCSLSPDDFVITTGCMEALNLALRTAARPGAVIAIESPTYYGVLMTIESLGMKALELPTHPSRGVALGELEKLLGRGKIDACLFAPNFNNPLGSLLSDEHKAKLAALLTKYDVPLIEDDIYGDLYFGESRPRTVKSFDRKGLVLLCSSFSKTLAPGYRVGFVAPGRYARRLEQVKFMNTVATNSPGQLTVAEYLSGGGYDRHLRNLRKVFAEQIRVAQELAGRHFPSGTRVSRPRGGFVLWLELPPGTDSHLLYNRALERGISFLPGLVFSYSEKFRHCIRISCGKPRDERSRRAFAELGEMAAEP